MNSNGEQSRTDPSAGPAGQRCDGDEPVHDAEPGVDPIRRSGTTKKLFPWFKYTALTENTRARV
ncbi:MAG: hypothetical protein O3A51_10550, partial [Verrucomicrobia bacterium]|nr:hypothetical protein [Verrucomicrobiota bacterium]